MAGFQTERLAPDAVAEVHAIIAACARDLKERLGLTHWDPPYPLHLLRRDAAERDVYAVRQDGRLVATFTLGTTPPPYYDMRIWAMPDARAMYVNRLAVRPELQGRSIGSACMKTVEELAAAAGCGAVRLDAAERYEQLLKFYERAGFERRGVLGADPANRFVCFEKRIVHPA